MPAFQDSKILPYKAEMVNNIILDIEKYPEFLPWCKNATVVSSNNNKIIADLIISFNFISKGYRSSIVTGEDDKNFTIEIESISGLFKQLKSNWVIEKLNNQCKVSFFIDFEFESVVMNKIVGAFFSLAVEKMIHAFEDRAAIISGNTVL